MINLLFTVISMPTHFLEILTRTFSGNFTKGLLGNVPVNNRSNITVSPEKIQRTSNFTPESSLR